MTDDWFGASLIEIGDWLNKFTEQEAVVVNPDDEIVAAIVQVLAAVEINRLAWQHVLAGLKTHSVLLPMPDPPA